MLSKLIVGSADLAAQKMSQILNEMGLKMSSPDVMVFDSETKIGVDEAKKVKEFLSIKPIGKYKAVIFEDTSRFSNLAQNSLLKTIEDLGETGIVIVIGKAKTDLIPTLLSRLEIINLDSREQTEGWELASKWLDANLEQKFAIIESEEKDELFGQIGNMVENSIHQDQTLTNLGKNLLIAEEYWIANGNQRAILEWLALTLE